MAVEQFVDFLKFVGRMLNDGSIGLIEQTSAPGTPPTNELTIYAKERSDGTTQLYYKDSGGTEHDLSTPITSAFLLSQVFRKEQRLVVREPDLALVDTTRGDVSTTKHGFVPKATGSTTNFLRADGTYASPVAGVTDVLVVQVFS